MTEQNKGLIEELEKRLLWYREEASAEEFDADEVDAICTMLLKLSAESRPRRTIDEAYRNILRQVDSEGEDSEADSEDGDTGNKYEKAETNGKKLYGSLRFFRKKKAVMRAAAVVIVVVGALTSLNMVSYARENKSLFTMILQKVGWLEVEKDATEEGGEVGGIKRMEIFYNSWAELDPELKEKIKVPEYIPEGYSLYGIRCWNSNNRKSIQANYYDRENGHLLIEITLWENHEYHYRETLMDEQIYTLLPEYSDENRYYYEYEDEYIGIVFTGDNSYRIEGNIPLEEIIRVGESL